MHNGFQWSKVQGPRASGPRASGPITNVNGVKVRETAAHCVKRVYKSGLLILTQIF
jgi:hypothetical protein